MATVRSGGGAVVWSNVAGGAKTRRRDEMTDPAAEASLANAARRLQGQVSVVSLAEEDLEKRLRAIAYAPVDAVVLDRYYWQLGHDVLEAVLREYPVSGGGGPAPQLEFVEGDGAPSVRDLPAFAAFDRENNVIRVEVARVFERPAPDPHYFARAAEATETEGILGADDNALNWTVRWLRHPFCVVDAVLTLAFDTQWRERLPLGPVVCDLVDRACTTRPGLYAYRHTAAQTQLPPTLSNPLMPHQFAPWWLLTGRTAMAALWTAIAAPASEHAEVSLRELRERWFHLVGARALAALKPPADASLLVKM